jgi:hypothetical protein
VSKFVTGLRVEQLEDTSHDGRGTWQLLTPLAYKSDVADMLFVVPAGFVTDFASVPRIPIAYLLAGDTAHQAAVVHDWLYSTHEVARDMADTVLREAALVSGVPAWRAWAIWVGVRVGGASRWRMTATPQPAPVASVIDATAPTATPVISATPAAA